MTDINAAARKAMNAINSRTGLSAVFAKPDGDVMTMDCDGARWKSTEDDAKRMALLVGVYDRDVEEGQIREDIAEMVAA